MKSLDTIEGDTVLVTRDGIFSDVLSLYQNDFGKRYPIKVQFKSENAIDFGGVSREMYSCFWEQAYQRLFDGDKILVPLLNSPECILSILGGVISHGFLVSGHLPIRVALPTLVGMLLGPLTPIPSSVLIDALVDFVSDTERLQLKSALQCSSAFSVAQKTDIISILSRFGSTEVPTVENLKKLLIESSNHFFVRRPASITLMISGGIPSNHKAFWSNLGVEGITNIYVSLSVSTSKVLGIINEPDFRNEEEERVYQYLIRMVGSMSVNALRNFIRFWTGSSVLTTNELSIMFTFGLYPYAHTCSNTLELPLHYKNYQDFETTWDTILKCVHEDWAWSMDGL